MTLQEAILKLNWISDDLCIVAQRPWVPNSEAKFTELTAEYRIPESIKASGYEYFLEVSLINEELLAHAKVKLSPAQKVEVAIYYAENDATPEWFNELCR
ncbi:hypothetical protein [Cellvibrio fibrivorans]|uniref:Uncharacterized protein n=1 Tax=Cellvibrio fibrivorans TaxID=126350 RepID=A0ABU1UTK7_9GAMM|nr:hypothetical protein [Cellvibrio fibrivorans]MDR7088514.1 hypothetical protein [Cellvibrio fibrivorans]